MEGKKKKNIGKRKINCENEKQKLDSPTSENVHDE